ncbi:MAG: hypothetical protein JXL84_21595 [Deltaproteobacteria bacterium]|nr:hypothetical protein [Deltaproteobacteria bacterium]
MFDPGSESCRARVGLLVLRVCGEPATAACTLCGLSLCSQHILIGQDGAPRCPSCALQDPDMASRPEFRRSRVRDEYYHDYGYEPHVLGGAGYYSAGDRASMDADRDAPPDSEFGPGEGEPPEEGMSQGGYDEMES